MVVSYHMYFSDITSYLTSYHLFSEYSPLYTTLHHSTPLHFDDLILPYSSFFSFFSSFAPLSILYVIARYVCGVVICQSCRMVSSPTSPLKNEEIIRNRWSQESLGGGKFSALIAAIQSNISAPSQI